MAIGNHLISGLFVLIVFLFIISPVFSQNKNWKPLFPVEDIGFSLSGWYIGAGATYTLSLPSTTEKIYEFDDNSKITANFVATGNAGFLLEGGRYTLLYSNFIPYIDYGLSVKMLSGNQDYTGYQGLIDNPDTTSTSTSSASFNNYYISAHFNANNAIRISEYGYIQNTLGVNFDYKAIESIQGSFPVFSDSKTESEKFLFQLHYKLGYGLRLDKKHFLIFTLETPVLTAFPEDDGKSTIALFNSRYRPIMFSVRLLFLRNTKRPDCTNKSSDMKMDKKRKKARLF